MEVKAVAALTPAHSAQLLTYPRMSRYHPGLLKNVRAAGLVDGPRRYIVSGVKTRFVALGDLVLTPC